MRLVSGRNLTHISGLWLLLFPVLVFGGEPGSAESYGPRADRGIFGERPADHGTYQDKSPDQGESAQRERLDPRLQLLLAALVPGLPQLLEGKSRAYGYFAAEAVSIAGLVVLTSRGDSHGSRYRTLAQTARRNFVFTGLRNNPDEVADPNIPGYGEYYEDMLKWSSSGDLDNDPSQPGIQPETDTRTYDGHQWQIAKINNYTLSNGGIPAPGSLEEVQLALEAYQRQVYPLELNWDWTGLDAEYREYHHLFDQSEAAYRRRSGFAALLLANHLVSVLDVLVSEKLGASNSLRKTGVQVHLEMRRPLSAPNGTPPLPAVTLSRRF